MNKGLFPKILPHLIAVVIFLVVALIYCRPALDGNVLQQEDITQWKAAMKELEDHKATHGEYPLWTKALFSGMPTFAIAYPSNNYVPWWVHNAVSLMLPKPIGFFFAACLCFYFLSQILRVNPYAGIFGALSFAYATYNPIIIAVGHDTKMWSIAYMPALLASILLLYDHRKYWLGAGLTALFSSVLIAMNHPQIAYYFFLAVGIMTVFFVVRWIREKQTAHLLKAVGLTIVAGAIGLLVNAVSIMATYEYSKETIRGGSALTATKEGESKEGLGKDYSFSYSLDIPEPFVMMVPRMFGGSSDKEEVSQEKSKAIEALASVPAELQRSMPLSYYWGGIGATSGPSYVGAIVCLLAILALFVLDNRHKWWMLATILITIVMSWGSYFESINILFYKYLPLYNKFRAPSMILVIPQLLLPALAVMGLHKIAFYDGKEPLWPAIKKGLFAVGAVLALLFIMYISFDYMGERDKEIMKQVNASNQPQVVEAFRSFYNGLKADRQSLFLGDIFRTIAYMGVGLLFIWLLYKRKLSYYLGFGAIALVGFIDLITIDSIYLNKDNYLEALEEGSEMVATTEADKSLLADTSYYRVLSDPSTSDPFTGNNYVAYHYNAVGGYHTARLSIFNDLIDSQLRKGNMAVYNMLNTKYVVQKDQTGATVNAQQNPAAIGPVWFVKNLKVVPNAVAEMNALNSFNPRDTAIIQQSFLKKVGNAPIAYPSAGSIRFIRNDNNEISYQSSSPNNEFAVFSEIYYEAGWKAFIDGKEAPIAKVNYVLRGLPIPAGNHNIVFKFEPQGFYTGKQLTTIFSIVMVLLLLAGIFFEWRSGRKRDVK
jgi:hypothetical protein